MQDSIASHLPSLLKASWQGAVLILLVLAVQWAFGRRLNPRWRYGLWLLVLMRLALPWTIPAPMSLFNVLNFHGMSASSGSLRAAPSHPNSAAQSTVAVSAQPTAGAPALQPTTAMSQLGSSLSWLLGLWLAGASAL